VTQSSDPTDRLVVTRELIEELLRTGFALGDLISSLLEDLPKGAFPGEQNTEVLIEMVVGTCLPVVAAAGERDCRAATALVGAVRDKVLADLRRAAELARDQEPRQG
jgi:hypothetical protein